MISYNQFKELFNKLELGAEIEINFNKIYEETNKVLDIIYKYYTEDGIRNI